MQYAWNMARFLSHEAKQLISCLILKALKQNSPFQARKTWYILCSSSHLDRTVHNAEKLDAPYVKYASFIKSWSKTTHFKGGSREAYRVLRPIKRDRVLHRHVQYAWNMPFSPDQKNKKKKWQTFIFFIWLISQNSVRFTYATTLFQVWEYVKIGFRVLAFLTYRDRVPFCPGFVSLIYLLWMFHDKKLTPL